MWKCKHCGREFNFTTVSEKANHSRWCEKNPKREDYVNGSDAALKAMAEKRKQSGFSNQYTKAKLLGLEPPRYVSPRIGLPGCKHTEETKRMMSEKRKLFLKNNPDKHPWRSNKKFVSVPCEQVKDFLKAEGLEFTPEAMPLYPDRNFAVDIAFPEKKICIDINGNQHYNSDKTLKPYYQERKDLLIAAGWKCYDYHYSLAYNPDKLKEIAETIKNDIALDTISYSFELRTRKRNPKMCECGKEIFKTSLYCKACSAKYKKQLPDKQGLTKEILEKLVWEMSLNQIGKIYKISGNSVKQKCKKYNISRPEKFHWLSKKKEPKGT
jgi:hypothetical protein